MHTLRTLSREKASKSRLDARTYVLDARAYVLDARAYVLDARAHVLDARAYVLVCVQHEIYSHPVLTLINPCIRAGMRQVSTRYVCMYVYLHVCMYVYLHVCMYVCMYIRTQCLPYHVKCITCSYKYVWT